MRSIQRHQPRPYRTPSTLGPVPAAFDDDDDDFDFDDPPGRKCGSKNSSRNSYSLVFSPTLLSSNTQRVPIKHPHKSQSPQQAVKPVLVPMHLPTSPTSVMFPIAEAEEEEDVEDVASSVASSNVLSGLAVSSTEVRCGSTNNSSITGPGMKFASHTVDELFLNFQAALERRENRKEDDNDDDEDKPESAYTTSTGGVVFGGPSPSSSWTTETTINNVTTYNQASRLALLARSAALTASLEETVTPPRSTRSLSSRTLPPATAGEGSNSSGNNNEHDNSLRSLGSRSGSSRRKDVTRSSLTRAAAMVEQQQQQQQQQQQEKLNEEKLLQQGQQKRVMTVRDLRNGRNHHTSKNKTASTVHDSHGNDDEEAEATRLIRHQLHSLQSQSHSSTATFRRALQRLSQDLRDSNGEVAALQVELRKAVAARDEKLTRLQWARDMREREVEAVAVQMLHYHIGLELLHAESSPSSLSSGNDDDERNEQRKAKILSAAGLSTLSETVAGKPTSSSMTRFKDVPTEELRVRKQRLQSILDLCESAKRKAIEGSSSFSNPAALTQARAMKEDAASKYLLYDKFRQI